MASEFSTECLLGITHKPLLHLAGLHVSNVLQSPNAGFPHLGATFLFQPMNLWEMFDFQSVRLTIFVITENPSGLIIPLSYK